jgi:hypothetical protein
MANHAHAAPGLLEVLVAHRRAAAPRPAPLDRHEELTRLCVLVTQEAQEVLEPRCAPGLYLRAAAERQALVLHRDAVSFCSRFLFFFCHLTPEVTHAAARQLVTALPLALELLLLLELWAAEEDSTLPPRLADQARACLGAFWLPLPGEDRASLRTLH